MDKYKVLLVDDEEEAIEAIRLKLEWETLGFEVIGSANGAATAGCGDHRYKNALYGRTGTGESPE